MTSTRTDLLAELARLEALFDDSITITREILSPIYDDPTSREPTRWYVSRRLQSLVVLKKETSK